MESFDKRNYIPKSDLEESQFENKHLLDGDQSIEEAMTNIGSALDQVSQLLEELENNQMLGSAIQRFAADLADTVGNVARDLDHGQDVQSKKMWARAFLRDAEEQLILEREQQNLAASHELGDRDHNQSIAGAEGSMTAARAISELSEDDLVEAMNATRTILLDVEDALRNISEDDAEEIAEVGLVVAKMFLWGLQNIHGQIVPSLLMRGDMDKQGIVHSIDIEVLSDDGDQDVDEKVNESQRRNMCVTKEHQRLRILWPPIGNAVGSVASWGKEKAVKNPILSIALAMTLWPAALIGAFLGGPILAADWCLQKSYDALRNQPVVEAAEMSAANIYQVGKFYFLVSKLMIKQSIRVGKRQIKRRGGLEQIAKDLGDWTIDRALHPVESVGMLWNSARWGAGKVIHGIQWMKDAAKGGIVIPSHATSNDVLYS